MGKHEQKNLQTFYTINYRINSAIVFNEIVKLLQRDWKTSWWGMLFFKKKIVEMKLSFIKSIKIRKKFYFEQPVLKRESRFQTNIILNNIIYALINLKIISVWS